MKPVSFSSEQLFALSCQWTAKHPNLINRIARAHLLVLNNSVRVLGDGEFAVDASDGQGAYIVAIGSDKTECTCADYANRKERCKHILAAALYYTLTKPRSSKPSRLAPVSL